MSVEDSCEAQDRRYDDMMAQAREKYEEGNKLIKRGRKKELEAREIKERAIRFKIMIDSEREGDGK